MLLVFLGMNGSDLSQCASSWANIFSFLGPSFQGVSDTFYTQDNHDAEAFLKPVSKADVPDYYDCESLASVLSRLKSESDVLFVKVISNPMDMQTMLKKVKQKQYKSKREFKDDLDLIWSNCYTYNATEVRISQNSAAQRSIQTGNEEPPPPPMRQTIKIESRQAPQEHYRSQGTHRPIDTL
jgi:Bromodomain